MTTTQKTPLIKIPHPNINIFAKLENYSPTGSIKYRMAKYILEQAIKNQQIKKEATIIEATTGNTGIAFAYLAQIHGYKMIAIMPENQSIERIEKMKQYNAQVILTPASQGPQGAIDKRDKLLKTIPNSWTPNQFNNIDNIKAHQYGIGKELISQFMAQSIIPHYFVHGVGTGGTLMGITKVLKSKYPHIKIIAVEPEESAVLSGSKKGYHNIQGIGEGFIPTLVDTNLIDKVITVHTDKAIKMLKYGISNWNISMGISSGANIVAIEKLAKIYDLGNKNIITIFADGIERYLSILNS